MSASATVVALSPAGPPDLYVLAADGVWTPGYRVTERVVDGVNRTTIYLHHTTGVAAVSPARLSQLADDGRVSADTMFGRMPVIAVVSDDDDVPVDRVEAVGFARSERLAGTTGDVEVSRWERLRRLLNARCGQLRTLTGEDADRTRHSAAGFASGRRTESSMELAEDDMEMAVAWVEDRLLASGFDMETADREYAERQAARAAGTYRRAA